MSGVYKYVTINEYAEHMGITSSAVRQRIAKGKLTAKRFKVDNHTELRIRFARLAVSPTGTEPSKASDPDLERANREIETLVSERQKVWLKDYVVQRGLVLFLVEQAHRLEDMSSLSPHDVEDTKKQMHATIDEIKHPSER